MSDQPEQEDAAGFDPDKREMCPDGMCIGVIGPDGRCKVCGKPGASGTRAAPEGGSSSWRPSAPPASGEDDEYEQGDDANRDRERSARPEPRGRAASFDVVGERVPCPDGLCTGIIGRDGRCGTCGKPHDWREPEP